MAAFKLIDYSDVASLQHAMVGALERELTRSGSAPYAVMLSGGKTPLEIFEMLAGRGLKASPSAHVCFSDERDVPVLSEQNNYHHTVELLKALEIPDTRVLRVHTEQPLEQAAGQYHDELQRFCDAGGRLTLGILGIGSDGHTASLFSPADVERGHGRYAVAIPHEPKPDRISVTPGFLSRFERLVILAAGPEKRDIISKLMRQPDDVVAGLALRQVGLVEVWHA